MCAYIRQNSKADSACKFTADIKRWSEEWVHWEKSIPPVGIDIQAIIDVIARRTYSQILRERKEGFSLDLRNCNLQRVDFRKGEINNALMSSSHMDVALMNNVRLTEASLSLAKFNGAALNSAILNLAHLNKAEFNHVVLTKAQLNGTALKDTQFIGAELTEAVLIEAKLSWANLNRANLTGAKLSGANLFMAQLDEACLIGAELDQTELIAAQTISTAVRSTDLSVAKNLREEQVSLMFGDMSTTLISEMDEMPKHWPTLDLNDLEFDQHWEDHKSPPP